MKIIPRIGVMLIALVTILTVGIAKAEVEQEWSGDLLPLDMFHEDGVDISPFRERETMSYEVDRDGKGVYHVYLSDSFEGATYYKDLARGIRLLEKGDELVFHIANYGGDVHGGLLIVNAIKASKAHIKAVVESPSYSMASILSCVVDELTIEPYAYLMFHEYSGGPNGKGSEARVFHKSFSRLGKKLLKDECVASKVLTQEQSDDIVKGIDIYIFPEDLTGEKL